MENLHSSTLQQYAIATIVNLGSLTTGISQGWPSPTIMKLHNGTDTPLSRPITDEEGSWIVSGGYLAATGTNLLCGFLMDKIGRKFCIIAVTIFRIFVSMWIIFVTEVWMLIFCRGVMVITDCFMYVVIPVYVSEIATKEHRGTLGTFIHITSCTGILISLAIGPFVTYTTFNVGLAALIVVASLPLLYLPESPIYLYSKGHIDDAIEVLSRIRHSDEIIDKELKDYKLSKQNKNDKFALFKKRSFLKALALGILICSGANAIGYSAISFYLQSVLDSSHTNVQPEIASLVIGCIQLFAAICTTFFSNVFGRRPMLIVSIVGMFFGMVGLATFFQISAIDGYLVTGFMNYLPIISLILCTYCFNIGMGYLLFVVTVELFETSVRAIGYSICFMANLFLMFLTSKYFAKMALTLGPSKTYWFFSLMCIIIGSLIALFVPETKDKSFGEIQISLGNKSIKTNYKENQDLLVTIQ